MSHVQPPYTEIDMQGGRGSSFSTSKNSENSENFKFKLRWQGTLTAILDLMNGSHLELSKMVAT